MAEDTPILHEGDVQNNAPVSPPSFNSSFRKDPTPREIFERAVWRMKIEANATPYTGKFELPNMELKTLDKSIAIAYGAQNPCFIAHRWWLQMMHYHESEEESTRMKEYRKFLRGIKKKGQPTDQEMEALVQRISTLGKR